MLRLLSIEYFKLKNLPFFWVLVGFFLVFLLSVPIASKAFLDWVDANGGNIIDKIAPGEIPLFDFVDIWQNLTWVYKTFAIFPGFITVISVCNEFSHGTIKQNVIDGLSRNEFLLSKVIFILASSLIFTVIVLIIGLIMGFLWSPVTDFPFIIKHIEFIPAYYLHLIGYQFFFLFMSLLIKRAGFAIAFITFYDFVIEVVITSILDLKYDLDLLADLFPLRALGNLIPIPFGKYIMRQTQTTVELDDFVIYAIYAGLFLFLSFRMIQKRDLR